MDPLEFRRCLDERARASAPRLLGSSPPFATCMFFAFLFPIVLLPYVSVVHGVLNAINGEPREPVFLFGLSDKAMRGLHVKPAGG